MEKLLREMATKRQLAALRDAGEEPYYDAGAMYVGRGEKRIMVRRGEKYTQAGEIWLQIGGANPIRYQGPLEISRSGRTQFVRVGNKRITLLKNGPDWQLTKHGKSRFHHLNQW